MSHDVWVLTFVLATAHPFVGGEYQDRWRCEQAAKLQLAHWQSLYGKVWWRCDKERR